MDDISLLLNRGVDTIYPSKAALEKVLRNGKKLKLYQGFDPTGTQLHLGHAVALRKLRQFQDLGHEVIFLIGDGTGQAGDPSGKIKTREKFYNADELRQNARDYVLQASKILRFEGNNPVRILYNGDWLNDLKLSDILGIAGHFSVQQFLERDMYQERIKKNETINLREFLYPILQGYDSVAMNVDLELGGTDQTFNMLMGRSLVEKLLHKEKFVMTVPLLTDAHGTKIGKTEGNVIALTDPPHELFGKIMALSDDAIINCFTLLTDKSDGDITSIQKQIAAGDNPMVYKKQLAHTIVASLCGGTEAEKALQHFEDTFQKGNAGLLTRPSSIAALSQNPISIIDLLMALKAVPSKSEARRLVESRAVEIDRTVVDMVQTKVTLSPGMILRVGKKQFIRFED